MIKNYLKIAFRNLVKNGTFSLINILGLSVGLSACMLIGLYLNYELSYDQFHDKGDRIARVVMEYKMGDNNSSISVTGTKVAPAFKRTFPEVENGVRMYKSELVVKYGEKQFSEPDFYYADSTFFDIFSFKLLQGNPSKALEGPYNVVLSESTAKKYFGDQDPLGKIIRLNDTRDFTVTGVAADCPENSQIKFDFLASFTSIPAARQEETWWNANWATFLLLKNTESFNSLEAKIPGYMRSQFSKDEMNAGDYLTYHMEPFNKVHLYSEVASSFEPNTSIRYIYIFLAVALMILGIACFTYMNLTTAKATERAKEVGMRKVLGAMRKQLFWQFISESVILTFAALLLAFVLLYFELGPFNQLVERDLSMSVIFAPLNLLFILSVCILIAVMAGSYPALILSGFQPLKVLKGAFKTSVSGLVLRKTLIIFQFSISVFFIIGTLVVKNQLAFIQNKKLGYNKDHVLILPTDGKVNKQLSTLKSELKSSSSVLGVSGAYETPVSVNGSYSIWTEGMPAGKSSNIAALPADEEFTQTAGLEVVSGDPLTKADMGRIGNEDSKMDYYYFTLNESAVKKLGWTNENAIGRKMNLGDGRNGEVKAVVKDFHFASLHQKIAPLVIFPDTYPNVIMVKLAGNNIPQTIDFIRNKWQVIAPHHPFSYKFMDDEFNNLYATEIRTGTAFSIFAFLAIFLAALGLLGLATFSIQQRIKEIGIRKVLGASVGGITYLISKDFMQLVLVAILIGSPAAYFTMKFWLQDFAYKADIAWWVFAVTGAGAMLITVLTVSWQAIKAALMNPVKSLKSE
jgi:putative ABC transport system permease protein